MKSWGHGHRRLGSRSPICKTSKPPVNQSAFAVLGVGRNGLLQGEAEQIILGLSSSYCPPLQNTLHSWALLRQQLRYSVRNVCRSWERGALARNIGIPSYKNSHKNPRTPVLGSSRMEEKKSRQKEKKVVRVRKIYLQPRKTSILFL